MHCTESRHGGAGGSASVLRTGDPDLNPGPDENCSLKFSNIGPIQKLRLRTQFLLKWNYKLE